ncbi:MAG TPA: GTP cyclohydrolase I FolE [Gemmataceae bacterium]|nr:GTP cyclohydrolase I FolE [Gemmataceae bacterium]
MDSTDRITETKTTAPRVPAAHGGRAGIDQARIRAAVRDILLAVGEDPDRDGLLETPARVARLYAEVFAGIHVDPRLLLRKTFEVEHEEMVLEKDIEFSSFCEHHLLPFSGRAHVAYIPTGRVVGLSKLARAVEAVARKPQIQERLTQEIADLIQEELAPRGVLVVVEATHTCMTVRGVRKPASVCVTSAARGLYQTNATARAEVLGHINNPRPAP